jgi:hypothetical protein
MSLTTSSPQTQSNVSPNIASFDPLTFCLDLREDLNFDPSSEAVYQALRTNNTLFHEIVHSWQLFSFTSGVLTGAIRPVQLELTSQFLLRTCRSLVKPLYRTFSREVGRSEKFTTHQIAWDIDTDEARAKFTVHKYHFDFEKLNAVLDDPRRFVRTEDQFFTEAFPPNMFYYDGFECALIDLAAMIRETVATQLRPLAWPGKRGLIELVRHTSQFDKMGGFQPSKEWRSAELGLAQIQEGHARFLEMQLCAALDSDKDSLDYFANNQYLGKRYVTAFNTFLERTGLPTPSGVLDWQVHLFVLACEYALNPTVPYVDEIDPENLFDQFHPGHRFAKACATIANLPSLAVPKRPQNPVDHAFLRSAFDAIEQVSRPQFAPPLAKALRRVGQLGDRCVTDSNYCNRPLFNVLGRHFGTVAIRRDNESSYVNPLTIVLDGASAIPFLMPPIIRTPKRSFYFRSPTYGGDQGAEGDMVSYFLSFVYCDLVHQLLAERGPFRFEYPMVPDNYREPIIGVVKKMFVEEIGVPIDSVQYA